MKIDLGSTIEYKKEGLYKRIEKLNNMYPNKFNTEVDFVASNGAYSLFISEKVKLLIVFDLNKDNLTEIKNNPERSDIKLVITSGSKTCFEAGLFDSLFAIEVFEHLDDFHTGIK